FFVCSSLLPASSFFPYTTLFRSGDTMMMSLYFTLGVFLLVTTRKPSAHRSLIAFTAWSSFAHAVVMTILGFHMPSERVGFWIGRSEEHTSELQSHLNLVCRLLLE